MELRLQVAGLLAGGGPGALDESGFEPRGGFAHAGGAPLASTLIVPRTQAGPRDQVPSGREAAHGRREWWSGGGRWCERARPERRPPDRWRRSPRRWRRSVADAGPTKSGDAG